MNKMALIGVTGLFLAAYCYGQDFREPTPAEITAAVNTMLAKCATENAYTATISLTPPDVKNKWDGLDPVGDQPTLPLEDIRKARENPANPGDNAPALVIALKFEEAYRIYGALAGTQKPYGLFTRVDYTYNLTAINSVACDHSVDIPGTQYSVQLIQELNDFQTVWLVENYPGNFYTAKEPISATTITYEFFSSSPNTVVRANYSYQLETIVNVINTGNATDNRYGYSNTTQDVTGTATITFDLTRPVIHYEGLKDSYGSLMRRPPVVPPGSPPPPTPDGNSFDWTRDGVDNPKPIPIFRGDSQTHAQLDYKSQKNVTFIRSIWGSHFINSSEVGMFTSNNYDKATDGTPGFGAAGAYVYREVYWQESSIPQYTKLMKTNMDAYTGTIQCSGNLGATYQRPAKDLNRSIADKAIYAVTIAAAVAGSLESPTVGIWLTIAAATGQFALTDTELPLQGESVATVSTGFMFPKNQLAKFTTNFNSIQPPPAGPKPPPSTVAKEYTVNDGLPGGQNPPGKHFTHVLGFSTTATDDVWTRAGLSWVDGVSINMIYVEVPEGGTASFEYTAAPTASTSVHLNLDPSGWEFSSTP